MAGVPAAILPIAGLSGLSGRGSEGLGRTVWDRVMCQVGPTQARYAPPRWRHRRSYAAS